MKVEKKLKTGSVKVDPKVHDVAAEYCRLHGIKMTFFVTEAVKEKIQKINANGKD